MTALQRATADRLIAAKGQTVTLTRTPSGAYDPATGEAAVTTSTLSGKGVILPLSAFAKSVGNIVEGDQQLLLGGSTEPKVDDLLTDATGATWSITAIEPLAPAGLNILFDCVIRRAA